MPRYAEPLFVFPMVECLARFISDKMQRSLISVARAAVLPRAAPVNARAMSNKAAPSFGAQFYNLVFKRNITYAAYIFGGAIVLEGIYGKATEGFWTAINYGVCFHYFPEYLARNYSNVSFMIMQRTYETVDWSVFKEGM